MIAQRPSLPLAVSATPTLLGIPLEIRTMIYKDCLCVDYYLVPYKETIHRHHPDDAIECPSLDLLATCVQIRNEAIPILYGGNKWRIVLDREPHSSDFRSIFKDYRSLFRHVIIYCAQLDVNPASLVTSGKDARIIFPKDKPSHRKLHKEWVHAAALRSLEYRVRQKIYAAMRMPKLASFIIDVDELHCPLGCCRLYILKEVVTGMVGCWGDMKARLGEGWMPAWEATFVGLANAEEVEIFRGLDDADPPIPYTVVLKQPESDNGDDDDADDDDSSDNPDDDSDDDTDPDDGNPDEQEEEDGDGGDANNGSRGNGASATHSHQRATAPCQPENDGHCPCPGCGACHRPNRLLDD